MNSTCYVRRDVYVCHTEDGTVLLDLHRDKYIGVNPADVLSLDAQVRGWPPRPVSFGDSGCAARSRTPVSELLAAGLLTTDSDAANPAPACSLEPPREAVSARYCKASITLKHVVCYVAALIITKMRQRFLPLHRIVHQVHRTHSAHKHSHHAASIEELRQLIAAYMRVRALFVTSTDRCLADSLTLLEFLKSYRIHPTLILGVRTRPFGAHSWLQHGGCVMNDSLEHVRSFVPILVV